MGKGSPQEAMALASHLRAHQILAVQSNWRDGVALKIPLASTSLCHSIAKAQQLL